VKRSHCCCGACHEVLLNAPSNDSCGSIEERFRINDHREPPLWAEQLISLVNYSTCAFSNCADAEHLRPECFKVNTRIQHTVSSPREHIASVISLT
jgi:hypothetical protein